LVPLDIKRTSNTNATPFSQICSKYVAHVKERFQNPIIVKDGYIGTSTKAMTRIRHSKGIQTNTITFTQNMPLRVKKETFLLNELLVNKQRFVDLLFKKLEEGNIEAILQTHSEIHTFLSW
jgi:hypothetical protein